MDEIVSKQWRRHIIEGAAIDRCLSGQSYENVVPELCRSIEPIRENGGAHRRVIVDDRVVQQRRAADARRRRNDPRYSGADVIRDEF
jgi:hypothetical protein